MIAMRMDGHQTEIGLKTKLDSEADIDVPMLL